MILELKNSFQELTGQLVIVEETINELEDKSTEIIQSETPSKTRVRKKNKQTVTLKPEYLRVLVTISNDLIHMWLRDSQVAQW